MKVNKFNIVDNYQEYYVYGISAIELADYSLCFYLNKYLDLKLSREVDFEFNSDIKDEFLHNFTFYSHSSSTNKLNTYLLTNTNQKYSIFPDYNFFNYILLFDRPLRESEVKFLYSRTSLIDKIFDINHIEFKNNNLYQHFCYELELFITNIAYIKENKKIQVLKTINEKYKL